MKSLSSLYGQHKKRIYIALGLLVAIALILALARSQGLEWSDIREAVKNAPAWIFLLGLFVGPPLGLPLSLFLFAVGARFGVALGTAYAVAAVAGHHVIALYLSRWFSGRFTANRQQTNLWAKLEEKAGGDPSKLLFFWGLLPGLPYVIKLYLPIAMGVKASPYLKWNTLGHALGAFLFVGFGNAAFDGISTEALILIAVGIAVAIGVRYLRNQVKSGSAKKPETLPKETPQNP